MNIEIYKNMIDESEAVFTDIFDTIIYRKNFPDYNKKLWCESIKTIFKLKTSLTNLVKIRDNVEKHLREKNKKNGHSYEFNYDEFLEVIYKKFNIKENKEIFEKKAKSIELDIEFNSQFIFKDIIDLLKYANNIHKKVYCISDMYLTKDMILELFKRHGIQNLFADVYISSEYLLNKIDGSLYEYVKSQYPKLHFERCLMIGDNYWYDSKNSSNAGFNGQFIDRSYLHAYYQEIKKNILSRKYINKLNIISEYYANFTDELYNYKQLKKICYDIYASDVKEVKYCKDDESIINRLKKLHNEMYLHHSINFVISKTPNFIVSNNVIEFNSKKYDVKLFSEDESAFMEILKCLTNIADESIDIKQLNRKLHKSKQDIPIDCLKKLGKQYAPVFKDYLGWILNEIKKKKIEKIYFFTREGEFFKNVFDEINNTSIKSYLLEVSRVATFFPSLRKIDINELQRLWSQYSIQSIGSLFKSLNLDINKYLNLIIKYNLNINDKIINPIDNVNLNKLFSDENFIKLATEDLNRSKTLLIEYFKDRDFININEEIAIVDIGWRGTIQDNICYIFSKVKINGYYFGLEKFLNKQPDNAHKYGYINQFYGRENILGDITPFEMLCNSCNGSTLGYEKNSDGIVTAIRKIDEVENESYYNCTKYIQDGVIENVNNKDIDVSKAFEEIVNIIYHPDKYVALTYFNLKHNEEFGLGEYVSKKAYISKIDILKGIYKWSYQTVLKRKLEQTSWPYGYLVANDLMKYSDKLPLKKIGKNDSVKCKKRIAWIMPDLLEGSGGHRTIISNANYLVKRGYQCDLYFNDDYVSTSEEITRKIEKFFGECLCNVYVGLNLRLNYDMIFATYSVITPEIVKNSDCQHKMYFVQDFEPWFNSMGDGYINKENSYREGFRMISIGNWLEHKITIEFDGKISSFPFCADLSIYKPLNIEKEDAICFIFQPDKPRRCVELGLRALKLVKAIKPNIKIYLYGSKQDYYVDFEHKNLHIISLEECNKLYNKCKVGLCISSSNPSRIPFEMMAAGLPVVDLYRENNLYDMPDQGVTLAYSNPQSIATAILNLLDNEKLSKSKSDYGIKYMRNYDISEGYKIFGDTVDKIFAGDDEIESDITKIYNNVPFPIRDDVKNFEFILRYHPDCHESTDYLRSLVVKKRKIKAIINPKRNLRLVKRGIKTVFKMPKIIIKKIVRK